MRSLSNKIVPIIHEMMAFFVIVLLFYFCFAMIFYVSEFYYVEDASNNFFSYLFEAWLIYFAAWNDASIKNSSMHWVYFIWLLFTIFGTIVVFNVLIAIVCDAYADLVFINQREETKAKLEMVSEVVEFRIFIKKIFC